jgi:hypothetical protein
MQRRVIADIETTGRLSTAASSRRSPETPKRGPDRPARKHWMEKTMAQPSDQPVDVDTELELAASKLHQARALLGGARDCLIGLGPLTPAQARWREAMMQAIEEGKDHIDEAKRVRYRA